MSYIDIFGTLKDASFNGTNLSTKGFYIYDVQKPLSPKQAQEVINIAKKSGVIQASKKFTGNQLALLGYVKTTNYSALKSTLRALAGFLYSDTDKQLIVNDETDIYWNCQYLESEIVGEKDDYTLINLLFTCNDPFGYAITADSEPDTSPATNVITTSGTTFIVANAGHTYAFPTITITFNQDMQHVYFANNTIVDDVANRFDVSKAFSSGDVLEVDCKNGTIKLNGASSPAGFGDGGSEMAEWIYLATGNNEIEVGTTDESIDLDVDISFEKVYLY